MEHPRHTVGEQAESTQASTASQAGQPLLGSPASQPLQGWVEGSATRIGPWL